MVTPSPEFFALTFAMLKSGIIPVMVDPGMGAAKLKKCFAEAEPLGFIGIPKAHIARVSAWLGQKNHPENGDRVPERVLNGENH